MINNAKLWIFYVFSKYITFFCRFLQKILLASEYFVNLRNVKTIENKLTHHTNSYL